jgi:hypothetical protein
MFPTSFDQSNTILDKPQELTRDECQPLNVCLTNLDNGNPVIISCWKMTKEELEEINKTGRVWLVVLGCMMPVIAVIGVNPFVEKEEKEKCPTCNTQHVECDTCACVWCLYCSGTKCICPSCGKNHAIGG